jgi:hypothetical protein
VIEVGAHAIECVLRVAEVAARLIETLACAVEIPALVIGTLARSVAASAHGIETRARLIVTPSRHSLTFAQPCYAARPNMKIQRALISVSDKTGLVPFAKE